jgi:hypothetical protein
MQLSIVDIVSDRSVVWTERRSMTTLSTRMGSWFEISRDNARIDKWAALGQSTVRKCGLILGHQCSLIRVLTPRAVTSVQAKCMNALSPLFGYSTIAFETHTHIYYVPLAYSGWKTKDLSRSEKKGDTFFKCRQLEKGWIRPPWKVSLFIGHELSRGRDGRT